VWDWSTNGQCNRPSSPIWFLQKLWSTVNFKYCSLIMCKADDARARIHIHPPALWLLHMEWKVWTLTPDFSLPNISSSQASLSGFHTAQTFPRQCEIRFSFSKNSSRPHCEIMLSNLNQLRPGVADFKSSSWQHHMTNSSQWCSYTHSNDQNVSAVELESSKNHWTCHPRP